MSTDEVSEAYIDEAKAQSFELQLLRVFENKAKSCLGLRAKVIKSLGNQSGAGTWLLHGDGIFRSLYCCH